MGGSEIFQIKCGDGFIGGLNIKGRRGTPTFVDHIFDILLSISKVRPKMLNLGALKGRKYSFQP